MSPVETEGKCSNVGIYEIGEMAREALQEGKERIIKLLGSGGERRGFEPGSLGGIEATVL